MRARIPLFLLLIALFATVYLLWGQWGSVDKEIADHLQSAEEQRHAYVVSHDFDLLKEKLIEVHRDHWTGVAQQEHQARVSSIFLSIIVLIMIVLIIREARKRPPSA